jgi:hypothetical protein
MHVTAVLSPKYRYCTANPQTPLPEAINALGRQMLAHPGGPL